MGFFSKKPKQRDWEDVCSQLSRLMEESRQRFFDAAVKTMEKSGKPVQNASLEGDGELALTAYQLERVSAFVCDLEYVDKRKLDDFDTFLLDQICGEKTDDYMAYIHRYYVQTGEPNVKLINDLIRFISDESEIDVSTVADLQNRERIFAQDAKIVTAVAFGDDKLAGHLMEKTKSAMTKLS